MIERTIDWCNANRFLLAFGVLALVLAGIWSLDRIPLDALPDISDVQVIIHTEWMGQPPNLIEAVSSKLIWVHRNRSVEHGSSERRDLEFLRHSAVRHSRAQYINNVCRSISNECKEIGEHVSVVRTFKKGFLDIAPAIMVNVN